ncbi:protein of unknown function [Streptomyces sp. KY75]|nr:protein of unknown function [Streptomyces sp. KY75]CAD5993377.1 protein of unknown function [Streptomyces sp. KY70]
MNTQRSAGHTDCHDTDWGRVFARIRARPDSCPHCGTTVCPADVGSVRNCACTRHGRSYDLADALVSAAKRSDHPESFGGVAGRGPS